MRKYLGPSLILALLLATMHTYQGTWVTPWFLLTLASIPLLIFTTYPLSWMSALLCYVGVQLIARYLYPGWEVGTDPDLLCMYREQVGEAFVCYVAFLGLLRLGGKNMHRVVDFLPWLQALGIFCIFIASNPQVEVPIFINPGMCAAFIALPSRNRKQPYAVWYSLFTLIAIYWTHSRTAWAIFAGCSLYEWRTWKSRAIALACIACVIPFLHHGDGGRLELWRHLSLWWQALPWNGLLFGVGIGTGYAWIPAIPMPERSPNFFVLHNDWFQLLVELGFVGFSLLWSTLAKIWSHMSRSGRTQMLAIGVWMCFDYPWHWAWSAVLCLCLILGGELNARNPVDEGESGSSGPSRFREGQRFQMVRVP